MEEGIKMKRITDIFLPILLFIVIIAVIIGASINSAERMQEFRKLDNICESIDFEYYNDYKMEEGYIQCCKTKYENHKQVDDECTTIELKKYMVLAKWI